MVEEGERKRESDEEIGIAVVVVVGEEVGGCNGGGERTRRKRKCRSRPSLALPMAPPCLCLFLGNKG